MPTKTSQLKPKATPESGQPKAKAKANQAQTDQTEARKAKTKASPTQTSQTKTRQANTDQAEASSTKTAPTKVRKTKAKASQTKTTQQPAQKAEPSAVVFSVETTQTCLSNLLAIVEPAVPTNPTHPMLGYLKIEVLPDACRITAADTSYTITATVGCETLHPGLGLLPTQLVQVIKAIPPSERLALVGSTLEGATKIQLSNGSGVISTTPIHLLADDFRVDDLTNPQFQHSLPAETLKLALQTVVGSAGPKDKAILHAVRLTFEANTLICQATDGHQITIATLEAQELGRRRRQTTEPGPVECCLPLDTVKALIKLLTQASKESEVQLRLDTGEAPKAQFHIQTDQAQVTLTGQCLADTYPDLQQVIESFTYGTSALVERNALLQQAKVIKAMDSKTPVAKLALGNASIHISMDGNEVSGSQSVQASLDMPDPEFETSLNLDLLINLARSATGDQLLLEFGSSESLIKLAPVASAIDGLTIVGYMMPVQVHQPDPST